MFRDKNLKEIQAVQLQILLEVKEICEKHGIRFFLIGGSALGAVRHQGFIPWDEDIDIGILREDYNRFIKIAPKELSDKLFLQTNVTDPKYPTLYAKVRANGTTYIEKESQFLKDEMHQGIFIDVFPLDYVSNNRIVEKIHFRVMHFFISIASSQAKNFPSNFLKRSIKKFYSSLFLYIFGKKNLEKIAEKVASLYSEIKTDKITNFYGRHREKETVPSKVFEKAEYLKFEDSTMPVPHLWDYYLKNLYGNYMEIPPDDEKYVHNLVFISSTEDYKEFFKNN